MRLIVYKADDAWLNVYADLASGYAMGQAALGFDQTPEWFTAYVAHVPEQPESTLMAGVVDETSNRLLLGVPLLSRVVGRLSIRYLTALSNYYTSLFKPILLASEQSQSDVVSGFVSGLEDGSLEWDEISLEPMADDVCFFQTLRHLLDVNGYSYSVSECFVNWYLETADLSYEAYEQALSSKLRNTLRRKQRKLSREHGYSIHIAQRSEGLDGFISDYEAVYQQSWKSEESHPQFIRSIIKTFALKGWLRLGLLYVADEPVAAQLWFVKDGVASIYKLSYDEQYAKHSVGTILTAAMMEQVIDVDRVRLVDFLTGDDAYKKGWMSHSQERYRIRIYNKSTWRGRLLAFWNMKAKKVLGRS